MSSAIADLRFEPVIPLAVIMALVIICVAVTALGFIARARGAALRACAFAVLLFWLAGPALVQETRQGLSDIGLLVLDQSASMQVGDRASLAARTASSLSQAAKHLPGLDLRTIIVPEAGHDGTQLWAATQRALADIPPDRLAGIIAITDGQIHDLPNTPPAAPLHALITARGEEWDRRIRVVEAPSYGIVGHPLDLRFIVEDIGPTNGAAPGFEPGFASVSVARDGGSPDILQVPVGEVQTVPVQITRPGVTLIKLATDVVPGEASGLNNQTIVKINGVRDRLRVLLVSGEPNQGERTWRRLLKSDPSVDLVHFTILRPPEKDDTTPLNELALIAFPTRELFQDKLAGFDLIILDRFTDRGILPHVYLRNIANYVKAGGALLLTVGPEFAGPRSLDQTPLSEILPAHAPGAGDTQSGVLDGAFVPAITKLGARHPVTEGLAGPDPAAPPAWGAWYRAMASEDVQGQVLMTGPGTSPLLILNRVGTGRAAMLMSDQIWLWSHGHQGIGAAAGGPQAELLRRVAHWLMKEPELDEDRFSAAITDGTLHIEHRTVAENAVTHVTITPPAGPVIEHNLTQVSPGLATATLAAPMPGIWQVSDGSRMAYAAAGLENPLEFADLRATADRVRPLVEASGGGVAFLGRGLPGLRLVSDTGGASGNGWIGLRRRGAHLVTGVDTTPLLPAWAALILLMGLVVAAWRREAR